MSKTARERPSRRHTRPQEHKDTVAVMRRTRKQVAAIVVTAILAGTPFVLGKYFELYNPDPFDSGSNVYSAQHILNGAKIGVEEKPSADLGTLLVNILGVRLFGFNEIGPKLIQGLFQAAALVLMFVAMRKLFNALSAAVAVIITSVYVSAPLIAKFGNVKEQYMIACMVMGVSFLVLRQLGGKWWLAVLAGAFVSWAPLFKPTGSSALGAMGLFVILQPVFGHRTWKQTGVDIGLLLLGAVLAIGPLYVWILGWNVQTGLPYRFVWYTLVGLLPAGQAAEQTQAGSDYVSEGRKLVPFSKQWPVVLRFYGLLILPVALAVASIVARILRMATRAIAKNAIPRKSYDRFVVLFAVWCLLDMAFVWISPHSYEQYYLPLNASAAMLGGYVVALYVDKLTRAVNKGPWGVLGAAGLVAMIAMSWHIFFGIRTSPYTGAKYDGSRRGYAQKLEEISLYRKKQVSYPWEEVGDYIRLQSAPDDKMYVWGWYPGIYVRAQRFSSASKAFAMPRPAPAALSEIIAELLAEFKQEMPKFIVDSRKRHVPTERPPYELWPIWPRGFMGAERDRFLPLDKNVIAEYDRLWGEMLRTRFDEDEALRYEAMKPFREFVMNNYRIVRMFGEHVLFQLKESPAAIQQR